MTDRDPRIDQIAALLGELPIRQRIQVLFACCRLSDIQLIAEHLNGFLNWDQVKTYRQRQLRELLFPTKD
jgi:hypothetical protein